MNLENKYRPTTIDGFAGLTAAKILMKQLIKNPYESSWLLRGDTGSGKTELAFMVSRAIGAEIIHLPSRQCDLESVDRLMHSLQYVPLFGNGWRAIIVDEADQVTTAAQHAFLSMLDGTATPQKTIFFFTANEPESGKSDRLEARFVGRCRYVPFNGRKELDASIEYLTGIWKKESRRATPDLRELLLENNGSIRAALNAMELELMAPGTSIAQACKHGENVTMINETGKLLYSIGHENITMKRFREIVSFLKVNTVIDCRSTPAKRQPDFTLSNLADTFGGRYIWKGDVLGHLAGRKSEDGLKWITALMRDPKRRPILLAKDEAPGSCYRHKNIAMGLLNKAGIDVQHICVSEVILASELQRSINEDDGYVYESLAV